jgi:NADH-quinone oxidoreductase subunit L
VEAHGGAGIQLGLLALGALASLAGILLAYAFFLQGRRRTAAISAWPSIVLVRRFWYAGWGFDWVVDRLAIRPYVWLAGKNKADGFDRFYAGVAWTGRAISRALASTQNGAVRRYAAGIVVGAVILVVMVVFL